MEKSFVFPSVLEENYRDFEKVADEFLDGIRITGLNGKDYIVGNLALKEGLSPHKFLNSSPDDADYQLLGLTGLLTATQGTYSNLIVTTGFPFTTYQPFKSAAADFFKGNHQINFDSRTLGSRGVEKVDFSIPEVDVMTEIEGSVKYIRNGEIKDNGNFIIASIGYGTFEIALSQPGGLVYRTAHSSSGIIYAIKLLENELQKKYYINILTDQQLERAFQRGSILIKRKRVDLTEIRDKVLESYYNEVISPSIRRNILDEDFYDVDKIYLVGGGSLYQKIVELFNKEFEDVLKVEVVPSPNLSASKGYCIHSLELAKAKMGDLGLENKSSFTCVGLDLGNNNTVVTVNNDF
ncbi:ParM/StbA family protein [Maribellus maritimus]|uniref:ParM/StbA family protein n=1 Tax=Maribellus maritimus TaxID=2870838 RepID=UPI001EEC41AD|nr:ParM/StbA family protein [Maribellus maritimus]MCG6188865.1 ParM/StbA family protein [Maribellus maritimus]